MAGLAGQVAPPAAPTACPICPWANAGTDRAAGTAEGLGTGGAGDPAVPAGGGRACDAAPPVAE
eukprot:6828575-Lingulodinium_polyedra.AAC.1